MKILKSIGAFFASIWRWIKNTAWVQPLLIVGVIFGVIFSIPAITKGITNIVDYYNSNEKYLKNFIKSLDGGVNSDADKLIKNFFTFNDAPDKKKAYEEIPMNEQKYFLLFTKSNDTDLSNVKTGFETLKDNWGKGNLYEPKDGKGFELYTIFTDEETDEATSGKTGFYQFLDRNPKFFEITAEVGEKSQYFINGKISKEQLEKVAACDESNFVTPTIVLIDYEDGNNEKGVKQVMFSVTGDNENLRAELLLDCWNGTGDFAAK